MNDLMTKSFTNYVDLKKAAMKDLDLESGNLEMMSSAAIHMDNDLNQFLAEAEKVKTEMDCIKSILLNLQQANEESKSLHKPEPLKALREKINSDILTVLKNARAIQTHLEEMDRANASYKRLSGQKPNDNSFTPIYRARIGVTNGLRKRLKELMMEFQALRQKMMTEYKETVGRRYFTVTGEYPGEEVIEKIISDGGEEYMGRAIELHGRGMVVEMVVEIKDRYDGAKEVEKSLLELHRLFMDMAVMVEVQGEKMDDIEHHVLSAGQYVSDGTKSLKTAKEYQRSSRKCMFLGLILLLVIVLAIVIGMTTS